MYLCFKRFLDERSKLYHKRDQLDSLITIYERIHLHREFVMKEERILDLLYEEFEYINDMKKMKLNQKLAYKIIKRAEGKIIQINPKLK